MTPEQQSQLGADMLALSKYEGKVDDLGELVLMYGVKYADNVMKGCGYLADNGGCKWQDNGPLARKVADDLGYTSVSNCAAMWRDAISNKLVIASVKCDEGWFELTNKGWTELDKWEKRDD